LNAPDAAPVAVSATARAARQAEVVAALSPLLPPHALLWHSEDTIPYECDGLSAYRQMPLLVALPESDAPVAGVLQACHRLPVPVVARGAGTGLSGGALPHAMGVTLSLAKFNHIVQLDRLARTATVQCGVRNLAISEAAAPHGLYYAPDPSSQIACTIGGNVAENAGGVHCLKYGLTLHNVLRVRGFTVEGEAVEFGSEALDVPGLDLLPLSWAALMVTPSPSPCLPHSALHHGELSRHPTSGRCGRRDHRRRHHSGRPRDDGQADDGCGGGFRPRLL
jgi:glycolate oxidase